MGDPGPQGDKGMKGERGLFGIEGIEGSKVRSLIFMSGVVSLGNLGRTSCHDGLMPLEQEVSWGIVM